MKKLTALFIVSLFAYAALSQGQFRVQAGPVFHYLHSEGNGSSFPNLHTGFTFGAAYEMIASSHFSVQPELNYAVLNTEETVTSSKIKLQYVQIPVLLKLVNDSRNFSFFVGPQLAFLTSAKSRTSAHTTDIKNNLTQDEFSGIVGIEFVFPQQLFIDVRFTQGFSNVYKVEFDSPSKTRNQILGFTVGYIFHNKK